jgi:putative FmdB family regulatory protein
VPTYQYACTDCAERLEVVQRFSDEPLTVCPACGSRLRKVFSPVGIVFKGSGFYRTDSRNGSGTRPGSKDTGHNGSEPSTSSAGDSGSGKDAGSSAGEKKPAPSVGAGASSSSGSSSSGSSS